jgi:nucleoside-diphosphate-sugar epimerase
MKKVLVVGGAGYVGGCTVDLLLSGGYDVTVLDNLAFESSYLKEVKFIYGDVRNYELLDNIIHDFDAIVWLAAIVGDGACEVDPSLTYAVNLDAAQWVSANFNGHLIFTSTCSVYGINENLIDESATPHPISLYARTKLKAEESFISRPNSTIFRLGTLFGLGDSFSRVRLDLVSNVLSMKAALNQPLKVFGGDQWRPLLHVQDVAGAIWWSLEQQIYGLFNLSHANYRIKDIAAAIQNVVPGTVIQFEELKTEDQRNYQVSTDLWKSKGGATNITLEEGISQMVDVFRQRRVPNPYNSVFSNVEHMKHSLNRFAYAS